ncbi:hypothetical protein KSP39_PZI003408 [Platanthera zijinensis]|uniref:DUF1764 domain-containing protein n=1 Tax=Platanthera zijinensis TaxID=2320716 RepID=A0AAP0BUM0_9ASPA
MKQKEDQSLPEKKKKKKMGREIEEIFRANKKKRKESPVLAGECSAKAKMGTGKEGKKVGEKKNESHEKEKKSSFKGFLAGDTPENRSKRRRTADGFALYSAEELGIGNPDAGSTPLCPFDCTCCF